MRYSAIVFIVLSIVCAEAKWATPIEITSYKDPVRITKSMYTDASSGVTHIAYCNSSDGSLYYANLDETGLFLTGPNKLSSGSRCHRVEVVGPHDGQKVYIEIEARRSMSIDECTPTNLGACDDIFIYESNNGGESWENLVSIGGNPGEPFRRRFSKVIQSWKTKYIWVMYTKVEGEKNALTVIRYDTQKRAFENERVLVPKFSGLDNYPLITYNDNGDTTLQLLYASPLTLSLQNLISTDLGVTWNKAESIKNVCVGGKYVVRQMTSKGKYLVAGCIKADITHFAFSQDNGKTWTIPQAYQNKDIEEMTFCGQEDPLSAKPHMIVLSRYRKDMNISYAPIASTDLKFADVPDAFYFAAFKMDISCHYRGDELKIRYMYHVRTPHDGSSKYSMFVIDNDNLADSLKKEEKVKEDL